MARNVGKLAVVVSASAGGLMAGLSQAQRAIQSFGSMAGMIAGSVGAAFGGLSIVSAGKWALGLAASMQQTQQQFRILIGDATQANSILSQLREFDIVSPLGLDPLLQGTKTLLQFGVEASQVVGISKQIADVSMGNADRFQLLSLAMGQVASSGRLQGQDLLQLINSGWNPLQQIAARTGETMVQVKERMSKGAVGLDEVKQALNDATTGSGRFAGMIDAASQTVGGRFDMLKGRVEAMATSIGERMLPAAMSLVVAMESIVNAVSAFDGNTALAVAQIGAFAAGFLLTIAYGAKLVAMIKNIVTAIRAMIAAQVMADAIATGGAGIVKIVAGLAVGAAAVVMIEQAFAGLDQSAASATASAEKLAKAAGNDKAAIVAKQVADSFKAVETAKTGIVGQHIEAEAAAQAKLNEAIKSGDAAAAKAARSSLRALEKQNSNALSLALAQVADKFNLVAAEAEKHVKLMERGAEIARQFEPPEATFATTVQELNALVASGAITGDTFAAAFADAASKLTEARNEAAGLNAEIQGTGAALADTSQGFAAMAQARLAGQRIEAQAQAAEANRIEIANLAAAAGAAVGPQAPAGPQFGGVSSVMADKFGLDLVRLMTDNNAKLGELVTETKREKKAVEVANVELY